MKTKFTRKFITLILSVVMIATLCVGFSVTAFAAETDYTAPAAGEAKIYGQNVNLGGDLSVKYWVEIGENVSASDLRLVVVYHGNKTELTNPTLNEKGYYVFNFEGIAPQCMGDNIAAELFIGDSETAADSKPTYSVADNLKNIYDGSDAKTQQLIIDTLEYGATAQTYREYKTDALVTSGFTAADSDTDVTVPENKPVLDDQSTAVSVSANVRYSAVNYLLFGLTGADSYDGKVTLDDSAVTGTMQDGYYAVATGAISPENFAQDFTMKYDNGDADYITLAYSVNDYCYAAYTSGTTRSMKDLASALYNYGLSAHLYLGEHSGGEATCTHGKLCDVCGTEYDTTLDSENHVSDNYSYEDNNDGTHKKICECGVTIAEAEDHTFGGNGKCVCEAVGFVYNSAENTYSVYLSGAMQTAIDYAELTGTTENPATVELMADMAVAGEPDEYGDVHQDILVNDGVVVLDLNGYTLTGSGEAWYIIAVGDENAETVATLTIIDGSEAKTGEIINTERVAVWVVEGSDLIVEGGYFEARIGVEGFNAGDITINGGTFRAETTNTYGDVSHALCPQNAQSLTITGGTFYGQNGALSIPKNIGKTVITGGSFTGGNYDLSTCGNTGFLSYDTETGNGPTFPEGLSIYTSDGALDYTLNSLLAEGAGYYDAEGNLLTLDEDAYSYEGDISVGCSHSLNTETSYTNNGDGTHTAAYTCCSATVKENHTLSYSANGAVVTASCSKDCGVADTATISATGKTYDGTAVTATVTGTGTLADEAFTVTYAVKDGNSLDSAPTNAGTYTASFTYGGETASVDFTIAKADPEPTVPTGLTATLGQTLADVSLPDGWAWADSSASVGSEGDNKFNATYTPADTANYNTITVQLTVTVSKASASVTTIPAAISGLEYTGEEQALVTAGAAEGGTIQYKLGEDGTYSETVPTASAVGEYIVYWRVVGDSDHSDTAEQSITVTISAKTVEENDVTVGNMEASYTYTGEAIKPEITVTVGGVQLTEGTDYELTYGENIYAGEGTITITFKGNYSGTVVIEFTITTAEGTGDFISDWMPVE